MRTTKYLFKKHFCTILFIFIALKGASQYEPTILSSNAWGIQNVNIDLFRGRINLSVPITVFKSKHLSHQISMSYTPFDINSSENTYHPGYYGIGWTLNAGGVITRTVKELPDEEINIGNFSNLMSNFNPSIYETHRFKYETGEDEFSFSFCGYSGTFFFYRGEWHFFSDVEFKIKSISFIEYEGVSRSLSSFVLVGPDATTYSFGGNNATETTIDQTSSSSITTVWYLTSIKSVEGDEILFEYSQTSLVEFTYVTNQVTVESKSYDPISQITTEYALINKFPTDTQISDLSVYRVVSPLFLRRIYSNNPKTLEIEFTTHPTANNRLHEILIKNKNLNLTYKKFSFDYYLTTGELLKLKSIQENALTPNGAYESIPHYMFEYKPSSDPVAPQVLWKLTYPMGGYSTFKFEPNIYTTIQPVQFEFSADQIGRYTSPPISSGFRISEQKTFSSDGETPMKLNYYYCNDFPNLSPNANNSSTGIMTEQAMKERFEFVSFLDGRNYTIRKQAPYNLMYKGEFLNKTIPLPMLGYSSVWVVQSNDNPIVNGLSLGYTNYKFSNYIESTLDSSLIYKDINEAGKLLWTKKYDSNKNILYSEENVYESVVKNSFNRYYLKALTFKPVGLMNNQTEYRYCAYTSHKKNCRLIRKISVENSIEQISRYYFDNNDNLSELKISEHRLNPEVLSSNTQINEIEYDHLYTTSTRFKYIEDFYDINIDAYNQYNITGNALIAKKIPVERVVRKNGKIVAAEFIIFKPIGVNYIVRPYQIYSLEVNEPIDDYQQPNYYWTNFDSRLKLKTTFSKYDQVGNLLEFQNVGEAPKAYFYENMLDLKPAIEAFNCTYNEIENIINSDYVLNLYRKNLSGSRIFSYRYNYNWDIIAITSPNGTRTLSEYDAFGRLKCIKDNNGKVIQANTYSYTTN